MTAERALPELPAYNIETTIQRIIDCTQKVSARLGKAWAAEEYEFWLAKELRADKLQYAQQYPFGVPFRGPQDRGFFADFVVEGRVLLELKVIPALTEQERIQAREYLGEAGTDFCLLINFGTQPIEIERFDATVN